MINSKKLFLIVLALLAISLGVVKFADHSSLLQDLSDHARQMKTADQYGGNPGGYEGSAAEWTRTALHR